jgi:hypothetical protein
MSAGCELFVGSGPLNLRTRFRRREEEALELVIIPLVSRVIGPTAIAETMPYSPGSAGPP